MQGPRKIMKDFARTCFFTGSCKIETKLGIFCVSFSDYFDREWNWDKIRNNSEWFLAFTSHPNKQTTTITNNMVNKKQQPHNNPTNIAEINNLDRSNSTTPNQNGTQNQEPALRQEAIELLNEQQIASIEDQKFVSSKLGIELQSLSSHSFETTLEDIFDDVIILVDEFQQE